MTTTPAPILPDITTPLIPDPNQPTPLPDTLVFNFDLGYLAALQGTWNSSRGTAATGYNVMSLPQVDAPKGYIVKDFPYYEEMTFAPIAGNAPNRGGYSTMNCNVLFYGQRVFIANNPAPTGVPSPQDTLIHAESGAWLHFVVTDQQEGPYGEVKSPTGKVPPQAVPIPSGASLPVLTADQQYVKQISIPHGNSILMVGGAIQGIGRPTDFPVADRKQLPFTDKSIIDPTTFLTNQLDTLANQGIYVTHYVKFDLATLMPGGGLVNIPFGNSLNATVQSMSTSFYIENLSNGSVQLQYSQLITMSLLVKGVEKTFLHIDANTLVKAS